MYSVSLLPYEYRMLHRSAQKKNIGYLAAIAVMGVLFVVYIVLTLAAAGRDYELKGIRAENNAVEAQISQLKDMDAIYNEVNSLLAQVSEAFGTNPDWAALLALAGNSVPESVSLSNINMVYEANNNGCVIQGEAFDYESVSVWMKELAQIEGFGEVKCSFSSQTAKMSDSPVQFELRISLLPGDGYKIPPEANSHE